MEEREHRGGDEHRRLRAARLLGVTLDRAVDEKVEDDVGAHLVERARLAVVAHDDFRHRCRPAEGGVERDQGSIDVRPSHPVTVGLDHDPSPRQRPFISFGEGRRAHRVDERAQLTAEGADRLRLRQCDSRLEHLVTELRFEFVHSGDQDLRVPFRDPGPLHRGQHRRIGVHHGLREAQQVAGGVLGDPERSRELQPNAPLHDLGQNSAVAGRVAKRLAPHGVDAHQPLRREHRHHVGRFDDQVEFIGKHPVREFGIDEHASTLEHTYDTAMGAQDFDGSSGSADASKNDDAAQTASRRCSLASGHRTARPAEAGRAVEVMRWISLRPPGRVPRRGSPSAGGRWRTGHRSS
ncbi:hypothetical protein ACI3KY_04025 [Microbacterium sp. ZW T2_14]|uniref:hypothetical protein n=1 Tax=Microbacterium sp. ZW T2_14 TaxID=3378079 RepID=UPI003852146E